MAGFRGLVVLTVCVFFSYSAIAQQCDQAIEDFHKCLKDSFKQGQQGQQRPNFAEIKQKADQCFTSNNCQAPQFPGGPGGRGGGQGAEGGAGRGGSRGGQGGSGGPQGGRAGRFGGGNGNDDGNGRKCFESVHKKAKDYILQCVRRSDPTFNPPQKDGKQGGFGGGRGGGEHGGFGDHQGGGFGGPQGHGGHPGGQQFLLKACNNDAASANKVNACLANAFPRQNVDHDQQRRAHCQAKSACKARLLPQCVTVLETRRKAMCTCGEEARGKSQEFRSSEPACAGQQENSNRPSGQGQRRDCNQPPPDPCQEGSAGVSDQGPRRG